MQKKVRNRKRYWNDVRALQKRFHLQSSDARKLWRKTVDDLGGERSRLSRESFTGKAKKVKKRFEAGEAFLGVTEFQHIDGPMTDAIRKRFEMRFEFFPWWRSNVTTPIDESEAFELRREMRSAGDDFFGPGDKGNVKISSDSWRIQDWIEVYVNASQHYYRFKWVR